MNELIEWLENNKIQYKVLESDVLDIQGLGKTFFQDMEKVKTLFKINIDKEVVFNCTEDIIALCDDDIHYVVFKFGDNWYYANLADDFKMHILKYLGERTPSDRKEQIVNLGCHTGFELLNGSFLPKDWVKKAKFLGQKAIGICDRNTMAACYNLQKSCLAEDIIPVFGYSLTVKEDDFSLDAKIYAQTQIGLQNLLRVQKAIMVDSADHTLSYNELIVRGKGNVLVLGKLSASWIVGHPDLIDELRKVFDKVYYQIDFSEYKAERIDVQVLNETKLYFTQIYNTHIVPPVLLCDAYYLDKSDAKNKIILNKTDTGAAHEQSDDQYFKDVDEHYEYFKNLFDSELWNIDSLFEECCNNAIEIANNAEARFENTRNFMPKYDMTPEEKEKYGTTHNMFNCLLEEGLERLIPEKDRDVYRKQMEYEKYIIESTNNVDYLLVQYDTCNYARRNNILVGCGRGSAAGSLLLYLLGITLVDPLKFGLIFERFLLPERAGLYSSKATIIGNDIESQNYVKIDLENGQTIEVDRDACLLVKRGEETLTVYADELQQEDDILFDNKDLLFTLNEI